MHRIVKILPIIAIAFVSLAASARGDDLLVVDSEGTLYRLENARAGLLGRSTSLTWKKVEPDQLGSSEFKTTGTGRIDNGRVEFLQGGRWVDTGINNPPPSITYDHAAADSSGNVFVQLGGNGRGFNFRSSTGTVIISRNMQWSGSTPDLVEVVPVPESSFWLGRDRSGKLYRITVPSGQQRAFSAEPLQIKNTSRIIAANNRVFAVEPDSGVLEIHNLKSAHPSDVSGSQMDLPEKAKGSKSFDVFSTADDPIRIQTATEARALEALNAMRNIPPHVDNVEADNRVPVPPQAAAEKPKGSDFDEADRFR